MALANGQRERVERLWRALLATFVLLFLLVVAHDVDHLVNEERLGDLSAGFWVFLPLQYGVFLGVLASVWFRYGSAPTLAAALAATSVIAFAGAHLLPFGLLPYADGDPLAISWALVFTPMAVAVAVMVISLRLRSDIQGQAPMRAVGAG